MQATNMYIRMEGMKFYAFHGVMPQENLVGANFYVDLKLKTDFTSAAQTDKLEGTVSYADIYNSVKEVMGTPSKLLEHVCHRRLQARSLWRMQDDILVRLRMQGGGEYFAWQS